MPEIMALTSDAILQRISESIEDIRRYGVRRIGLFGSYAFLCEVNNRKK